MYSLLLVLIYIAFISLGLPDSLLGAGWPVMHDTLNVPISYMGIISMIISGGTILSSLMSDRVTRKFGTHIVTVVSVFLTAAAMLGFSVSNRFWMLVLFAIPYGFGAGAIDAGLNNYVAIHYTSRHMSWLHCFWGVGAFTSPFVMSYALTKLTWQGGYRIIATIQFVIGLILLITLPVWKIDRKSVGDGSKGIGLSGVLRIRGVPFLLLGFFAYCALEATAMSWASTYMVEARGAAAELAARFAALLYIGLTLGRFLCGFIMNRLGDRRMILLGIGVLSCGLLALLIPTGSFTVPLIGYFIIGLGCAPIYPCFIHTTPTIFGADRSGAIIGVQMAGAYLGSTFLPPLFGVIGNHTTFAVFPVYLIVFVILMLLMVRKLYGAAADGTVQEKRRSM